MPLGGRARTAAGQGTGLSPPPRAKVPWDISAPTPDAHNRRTFAAPHRVPRGRSGVLRPRREPEDSGEVASSTGDSGEVEQSDASPPAPSPAEAKSPFWAAFTAERYEDAKAVTVMLHAALESAPEDAELTLLLAHTYLWRLAEFERAAVPDPSDIPELAYGAQATFEPASAMNPDDSRIWGWLGAVLVGNGHATGNEAALEAGFELIDAGVQANVEFNGFVLSVAHAAAPVDSAEFELAQAVMWDSIEACAGFEVNRTNPEMKEVVDAVYTDDAPRVCRSGPKAAHGLEGFFLYFGDLLVKAGDAQGAAAMYAATKHVPSYDSWPYRYLVADREATLEERLAAYDNADAGDDPRFVTDEPFNCAFCHAAAQSE